MTSKNGIIENSSVIEMTRKYPFSQGQPEALVKCTRNFNQSEYSELRGRIQTHSKLQHQSLIRIVRAFESKKNHYFHIFYERVPISLRDALFSLSHQELICIRQELLNFCTYLIYLGIYPGVGEEVLGVTQQKRLKLYLDVDYSPVTGNFQNLIKAKTIEVHNIFKIYEEIVQRNNARVENGLLTASSPCRKQDTPTILNVQYNVHHSISPTHHQGLFKKERNLFGESESQIDMGRPPGFEYLREKESQPQSPAVESPVPTTNFSGAASKISEMEGFKHFQMGEKEREMVKPYRENKFERKFSTKSFTNRDEDMGVQQIKSQSLRHTLNNEGKHRILTKKEELRISFDRLSSKLVRLQLALGEQSEHQREKEKKKQQIIKNIKTGRMHLEEMDNAVSEEDNQETKLETGEIMLPPASQWRSSEWNRTRQQGLMLGGGEKKKTTFQDIHEKVKRAIDKTELTFKKYSETKSK